MTLTTERSQIQSEEYIRRVICAQVPPIERIQLALSHSVSLFQMHHKSWFADELSTGDIVFLLTDAKLSAARLEASGNLLNVDELICCLKYGERNPIPPPPKPPKTERIVYERYQEMLPCAIIHNKPVCSRQAHAISHLTASELWFQIQGRFPSYANMSRPMSSDVKDAWLKFHNYISQYKLIQQKEKEKAKLENKRLAEERKKRKLFVPPSLPPPPPIPTPVPAPIPAPIHHTSHVSPTVPPVVPSIPSPLPPIPSPMPCPPVVVCAVPDIKRNVPKKVIQKPKLKPKAFTPPPRLSQPTSTTQPSTKKRKAITPPAPTVTRETSPVTMIETLSGRKSVQVSRYSPAAFESTNKRARKSVKNS